MGEWGTKAGPMTRSTPSARRLRPLRFSLKLRRRLALTLGLAAPVLCLGALPGCHDSSGGTADAAPSAVPLTPMGMASAATLVTTTNAVEVLTKLHQPREAVLGKDALYVLDIPGDAPDPDEAIDVMSVPLTVGGTATKAYPGQHGAEGLAFAGGRLVWITSPSADGKQHLKIVSAMLGASGAAAKPATVAQTYDVDETLAVSDGTDVFAFGDVKSGKGGPELLRIGSNGKAAVVTVGAGQIVRTALAVNGTHVFWVQGGSVVRAPKGGGDAAPVAKLPPGKIQRMAADDTAVYWTDTGTGDPQWSSRVYRATLADGKVETLSDAPSPFLDRPRRRYGLLVVQHRRRRAHPRAQEDRRRDARPRQRAAQTARRRRGCQVRLLGERRGRQRVPRGEGGARGAVGPTGAVVQGPARPVQRTPYPLRRMQNPSRRTPYPLQRIQNLSRQTPYPLRRMQNLSRQTPYSLRRIQNPLRRTPDPLRQAHVAWGPRPTATHSTAAPPRSRSRRPCAFEW